MSGPMPLVGGRQDVRQRQLARLGGEGPHAAGHPRGVRGKLRAHPSLEPHRHGRQMPLQFEEGESAESLGLDGSEKYTVGAVDFSKGPARAARGGRYGEKKAGGSEVAFKATVRVDTPTEGASTSSMAAFCSTFFASWRNRGGGRTRRFAKGECNASWRGRGVDRLSSQRI